MIYLGGKEVKEIYLGSVPVSEVYIGSRLVWRSRIYLSTGATAAAILVCDAEILNAEGMTYSTETAVLSSMAYAEPYMRHVAPIISVNNAAATYSAMTEKASSELYAADESGGGIYCARGVAAEGGADTIMSSASPIEEANITAGSGGILRENNTDIAVQRAQAIEADSSIGETEKESLTAVCNTSATSVHGHAAMLSETCTSLQEAMGNTADSNSFDGNCEKPLTAVSDIPVSYSDVLPTRGGGKIMTVCRPKSAKGTVRTAEACAAHCGICIASMVTEIYEEPVHSNFDSTVITEIDLLPIADIDLMRIV